MKTEEVDDRMLPMKAMSRRYDVSVRTVERWEEAGILPSPVVIGGRKYWRLSQLKEFERSRERQPNG
jgi:DNA-binding transcriptional MerR regulator